MPEAVKADALVVPGGVAWNDLIKLLPALEGAKLVWAGTDAPGIFFNEARTECVIKLPPPKVKATATCNEGDGTITFDFEFS